MNLLQEKKVTIVHGGSHLLNPAYPDKLRILAEKGLRLRGIELILDDYIDIAESKEVQGVTTRAGKELKDTDFVVCFSFVIYITP